MIIWALTQENMSLGLANNKGTDQPVHARSLFFAFWEVTYLDLCWKVLHYGQMSLSLSKT